jgi:hypothetical protein
VDVDLLTTDARVLQRGTWDELVRGGASVDARRGDEDDPLGGVVHIVLADMTDIDLVVAKWQWEADVISRAEPMEIARGVTLGVPRASDLILLKLAAGGFLDLRDAAALLEIGDRDALIRDVNATITAVRPDVRSTWSDLLKSLGGSSG